MLRLPEILLSGYSKPIAFSKICTADKSLAYIGQKFHMRRLYSNKEDYLPMLEVDYSELSSVIGKDTDKFISIISGYNKNRARKRNPLNKNQRSTTTKHLIKSLEDEVREFCTY